MDIDLYQLPIPNWNLRCPTCAYLLNGLTSHRCPECGTAFDVPQLIESWVRLRNPRYTGNELPFPDFGLACGDCGQTLAGAEQQACPACRRPFDPQAVRPTGDWFGATPQWRLGIPLHVVMLMLDEADIPYVLQERQHAFVSRPPELFVVSEFFFDFLHLIHARALEKKYVDEEQSAPDWQCPACGAEIPGHFHLCWNCQHERNEA
jgi:ssDNA-binding Zn-finger/Zn-ribbon topoisomerase 1